MSALPAGSQDAAASAPPADLQDGVASRRGAARRGRGPRTLSGWLGLLIGNALAAPLQILLLGSAGAGVFVAAVLPELPEIETLRDVRLQEPLRVFGADGALLAEFGVEQRRPVSYAEVPAPVIQAFLAAEDSRFFEHRGIDPQGLARAVLNEATTGDRSQGGSTISMQVVRNYLLTPEKTLQRKLSELLLTLHLERSLTKEEILELYLNKIFFGHRTYGISAAAALYYNKDLRALNVAEIAMLAGIPKAPSLNNPVSNPARARERRDYILGRMLELGYLDRPTWEAAIAEPDQARLYRAQPELDAGHVAEMARLEIVRHFGEEAVNQGYRVFTTVDSRLQRAAQTAVREALRLYDRRHGWRGVEARVERLPAGGNAAELEAALAILPPAPGLATGLVARADARAAEIWLGPDRRIRLGLAEMSWANAYRNPNWRGSRPRRVTELLRAGDLVRVRQYDGVHWELAQRPRVEGSLVAMDPRDGTLLALVGGHDFNVSNFNRAVEMRRQPGSSFKPFVYAAALERGWTPASLLRDESVTLPANTKWNPANADGRELGPIRMRRALALSRNLASINLLQDVGLETVRAWLRRFGFADETLPPGLSLALGSGELSPIKLAEGYAVFANGGYHVIPYFIERIEDSQGRVVFSARPPRACERCWYQEEGAALTAALTDAPPAQRVLDPRLAWLMTSMLREVIDTGTGTRAKRLNRPDIVGKTGTTNEVRDSWFAGYQARIVAVAWMGFDDFGPLGRGEEGGRAALSLWTDFMEAALQEVPVAEVEPPAGLVRIRIDPAQGTEVGGGGILETVQEEFRLMLLGPRPVRFERPAAGGGRPAPAEPNGAPRMIDDLF